MVQPGASVDVCGCAVFVFERGLDGGYVAVLAWGLDVQVWSVGDHVHGIYVVWSVADLCDFCTLCDGWFGGIEVGLNNDAWWDFTVFTIIMVVIIAIIVTVAVAMIIIMTIIIIVIISAAAAVVVMSWRFCSREC